MSAKPVTAANAAMRRIDAVIRAAVWFVLGAAGLYLGLALWFGWRDLGAALLQLGAGALLAGAGISMITYLLRFVRWQHVLRAMSMPVPARLSLPIYTSGLALTASPGKIGETMRTILLMRLGVPAGAGLAAFFIDRFSDLVGVFALTALSGRRLSWWLGTAAITAFGLALGWLTGHPRAQRWLKTPLRQGSLNRLRCLAETGRTYFLAAWRPQALAYYAFIAVVAYGLQAMVFAAYVGRLWPALDSIRAIHIFCVATLAGAASMLPGGLGAMELAVIGLLVDDGVPVTLATAAAVAIRTVTLWHGILLGVASLLVIRKHLP